jgi:hypothetical protein
MEILKFRVKCKNSQTPQVIIVNVSNITIVFIKRTVGRQRQFVFYCRYVTEMRIPVVNLIKLFCRNFAAFGILAPSFAVSYSATVVNYAEKFCQIGT